MKDHPKKEIREDLQKQGRIKELAFCRVMSSNEVHMMVYRAFQVIKLQNFQYLKCCKDSSLSISENQMLDGNGVITLYGCGSLYLHELPLPSSSCSITKATNASAASTTSTVAISTDMYSAASTAAISILARSTEAISTPILARSTSILARSTAAISTPILAKSTPNQARSTTTISTTAARYTAAGIMSTMPISTAASTNTQVSSAAKAYNIIIKCLHIGTANYIIDMLGE